MAEIKRRGERFAELDGLRGLAVIGLVAAHYTTTLDSLIGGVAPPSLRLPFGLYGVQLFFLISGFVILMAAWRARRPSYFAISRASRLYPTYWIALALGTLVAFAWTALPNPSAGLVAINATMVQRWFLVPDIVDGTWMLAVEVQFYVVVIIMMLISRGQFTDRAVLITMSTWSLLGASIALMMGQDMGGTPTEELPRMVRLAVNLLLPEFAPLFAAGCSAYLWRTRHCRCGGRSVPRSSPQQPRAHSMA